MIRNRIYCDKDFYTGFIEKPPVSISENMENSRIWLDYVNLIHNSDVCLNISIQEFNEKIENYKYLWKNVVSGKCKLLFDENQFPNNKNIETLIINDTCFSSSIFFFNKPSGYCQKFENDYGLLVINNDNATDRWSILFKPIFEIIKKNSQTTTPWSNLIKYRMPCNSLIIFDRYLKNDVNQNLFPILDNLLPLSLKIPFHITISILDSEPPNICQNFETSIREYLKLRKPDLPIRLCLLSFRTEQGHDRDLLTNYLWITETAGFDTYRGNKAKNTNKIVGFFSTYTERDSLEIRSTLIEEIGNIFKSSVQREFLTTYWGEKENRLLK